MVRNPRSAGLPKRGVALRYTSLADRAGGEGELAGSCPAGASRPGGRLRAARPTAVIRDNMSFSERTLSMTEVSITVVCRRLAAGGLLLFTLVRGAAAQNIKVTQALEGFDAYMAKTLKDWNAPGVGVGIVVNDKLEFAKGYGFR